METRTLYYCKQGHAHSQLHYVALCDNVAKAEGTYPMSDWTTVPHFCWYGRHPECDAETDRLTELET